ncbi:serine/threonine protein kinase [Nocardioides carbamazepini]|jgi:serine/threonine protein kinase|uniref:serine/threonine-protein kinase n=1 Tax=Nocardioides carbamazepini TaxID=2854259 RepID=UPI00214A1BE9|nr:serine/threonine-protein kinase [Nocardioides carbamazepini]MCR1783371.1 serine/threonine protein kinase [Nocardioides carbamazepini]
MSAALSSWDLAEGDAITPELTALRLLGGGSAYEAYLAFDEITYGPVVVKVVRPAEAQDEHTRDNLVREATALDVAHHPVTVRGLRYDVAGPRPHLVLEHVEGPSLAGLIRRHRRLSPQQYLPLAVDLASALHFFRHADVCHLDLKPSNVIMGSPARLIDFSVARQAAHAAEITGHIGTDAYMAPEQAAPGAAYGVPGQASDVWGLGATLFHAIAGYRPFRDGDPDAAGAADRFPQLLEAPVELPDDVPAVVAKVVHALLEPDPAARPLPREVAEALEPEIAALPAPRLHWKG